MTVVYRRLHQVKQHLRAEDVSAHMFLLECPEVPDMSASLTAVALHRSPWESGGRAGIPLPAWELYEWPRKETLSRTKLTQSPLDLWEGTTWLFQQASVSKKCPQGRRFSLGCKNTLRWKCLTVALLLHTEPINNNYKSNNNNNL